MINTAADIQKTAMFTGHRHISAAECKRLRLVLPALITDLFSDGITQFISGAAIGFDTLAAQAVLSVQATGLPVTLVLAIPCMHQDARWRSSDQAVYADLMKRANRVFYTSATPYYNGCMQVRNRCMVESAAVCIAYFNGESIGGTASTYRLAHTFGRRIFNLCPPAHHASQLRLSDTDGAD